jgi:hypothetical protein
MGLTSSALKVNRQRYNRKLRNVIRRGFGVTAVWANGARREDRLAAVCASNALECISLAVKTPILCDVHVLVPYTLLN